MKPYEFIALRDDFYLIRWSRNPTRLEAFEFVNDHIALLDHAPQKINIISDLRQGYIRDGEVLRQLANLLDHPNYGIGTAFGGGNTMAGIFVNLFFKLTRRTGMRHNMWRTPMEALRFLESEQPGITEGIDLDVILHEEPVAQS